MPQPNSSRVDTPSQPVRPSPNAPFHPHSDQTTYRDLLLFEERLKMNAEMLRRRRRRYSAFLWTFIGMLVIMAYRLVFIPPKTLLLFRALQASLAVVFITLALFFASGMYEEKIRYAHSYINHSNKALRPLNMHLNMRLPRSPLLSLIPFLSSPPSPTTSNSPMLNHLSNGKSVSSIGNGKKSNTVMATIPPSTNPRGELIFSSRVDRGFREGYERYRANFERRREERIRMDKINSRSRWNPRYWLWRDKMEKNLESGGSGQSGRGVGTPTSTPPMSRRGTPPLGVGSLGPAGHGRRSPSPGAGGGGLPSRLREQSGG